MLEIKVFLNFRRSIRVFFTEVTALTPFLRFGIRGENMKSVNQVQTKCKPSVNLLLPFCCTFVEVLPKFCRSFAALPPTFCPSGLAHVRPKSGASAQTGTLPSRDSVEFASAARRPLKSIAPKSRIVTSDYSKSISGSA